MAKVEVVFEDDGGQVIGTQVYFCSSCRPMTSNASHALHADTGPWRTSSIGFSTWPLTRTSRAPARTTLRPTLLRSAASSNRLARQDVGGSSRPVSIKGCARVRP